MAYFGYALWMNFLSSSPKKDFPFCSLERILEEYWIRFLINNRVTSSYTSMVFNPVLYNSVNLSHTEYTQATKSVYAIMVKYLCNDGVHAVDDQ